MSVEPQGFGISGGLALGLLTFAAASYFITGPLVAERTIAKSNWPQICQSAINQEIAATRKPKAIIPKTDCRSLLGGFLPELGRLCEHYGNPDFGGPMRGVLQEQERQRQALEDARIASATSKTGARCDCASAVFIEEQRMSLALYAGSARLIEPPVIKSLDSELVRGLHHPRCAIKTS